MPTVARIGPYRFFFYSDEGDEPRHVHVRRANDVAKFWLEPVELAQSRGFAAHELTSLMRLVRERQREFTEAWNAYFAG